MKRGPSPVPLIVAGFALAITVWLAWRELRPGPLVSDAEPRVVAPRGELASFEQTAIRIFQENAPSVVHITSRTRGSRFRPGSEGSGTGFVWDSRGYVVTNYHVVQREDSEVLVRFSGRRSLRGAVVGGEPTLDVAVVKLLDPPEELRPIPVGSSRDLQVGQSVFAIGNPFGLDHSLTAGVVSALDRVIESVAGTPIQGVIQVDAAINPGNSGGPLLDSAGRLIGMNTAIMSPTGANAGIGFAVPVDTINRVVPRLIEGELGKRPALGVVLAEYAYRSRLGRHPMIEQVMPGSGAAEAGLEGADGDGYGDIILAVDGAPIGGIEDLLAVLDQKELGQTIQLRILRDSGNGELVEQEVPVVLKMENERR